MRNERSRNIKKYVKLYNEDFKKWFLENIKREYSKNTYLRYEGFMRRIGVMEEAKNKDVFDFSHDELLGLIHNLRAGSKNAVLNCISILKKYLKFAMSENQIKTSILSTDLITPDEIEDLINPIAGDFRIITREELYTEIIDVLKNEQDRAMFLLIFEGVHYKDLGRMKVADLDFSNNTLTYKARKIKLNEILATTLKEAINETIYNKYPEGGSYNFAKDEFILPPAAMTKSGEKDKRMQKNLVPFSEYVFKQDVASKNPNAPVKASTLNNRLLKIVEKLNISVGYLTNNTLYNSGLVDRILDYEKGLNRELQYKDIKEYIEMYDENTNASYLQDIIKYIKSNKN